MPLGTSPLEENVRKYRRVIFVAGNGITRAPMAAEIFKTLCNEDMEILSRGVIVAFPEPLNQKTEAVMISNGIVVENYESKQIENDEITEDTIVFVMEERRRIKLIEELENATEENTFVLTTFVGEELEIMDPYGGTLQTYGICFEMLKATLTKVARKLEQNSPDDET